MFESRCRFTDDTVCTLAVAEALMGDGDFAAALRLFVRRHPQRGYGGMFVRWAFEDDAPAYGSWGNGAPMRVAAVGWLAETATEADELAAAQAAVSHDHAHAIAGSQAVARAIVALRRGEPPDAVRAFVTERYGYDLRPETALVGRGFDVSAAGTVPPALAAAFESADWESAVRTAIGLGGDTDTLACIAGAVAEAIHGVPADIAEGAHGYLTEDLTRVLVPQWQQASVILVFTAVMFGLGAIKQACREHRIDEVELAALRFGSQWGLYAGIAVLCLAFFLPP